jgi:hypothetical protein
MPFTTSHPAIVLPLKKLWPRWFSLSGLMAGAMSPDLQYFLLADTTHRGNSHSWLGLFAICLPLGLAFVFAFHRLFKREFIEHLPRPFDRALSGLARARFQPGSAREWVILIVSVLIGALSHFFWDSFTHPNGELAQRIPWLLEQNTFFGITRHNTRWLQHISSLLGAAGVIIGIWKWRLYPPPVSNREVRAGAQKLSFWVYGCLAGLLFASAAVWFYNGYYDWQIEQGHSLNLAFMSFGLGSWAGFFWYVCVRTLIRRDTQ